MASILGLPAEKQPAASRKKGVVGKTGRKIPAVPSDRDKNPTIVSNIFLMFMTYSHPRALARIKKLKVFIFQLFPFLALGPGISQVPGLFLFLLLLGYQSFLTGYLLNRFNILGHFQYPQILTFFAADCVVTD